MEPSLRSGGCIFRGLLCDGFWFLWFGLWLWRGFRFRLWLRSGGWWLTIWLWFGGRWGRLLRLLVGRALHRLRTFNNGIDIGFECIVVEIAAPMSEVSRLYLAKAKGNIYVVDKRGEENVSGCPFIGFIGDKARGNRIARPNNNHRSS